jgi:hypothetical protein
MTAKRIDSNQTEIVKAFRTCGASVWITSSLGKGAPDCVVGYAGQNWLVEIKDGEKSPSQQNLTPCETKFHESWKGKIIIIRSVDEVIRFINGLTRSSMGFC